MQSLLPSHSSGSRDVSVGCLAVLQASNGPVVGHATSLFAGITGVIVGRLPARDGM